MDKEAFHIARCRLESKFEKPKYVKAESDGNDYLKELTRANLALSKSEEMQEQIKEEHVLRERDLMERLENMELKLNASDLSKVALEKSINEFDYNLKSAVARQAECEEEYMEKYEHFVSNKTRFHMSDIFEQIGLYSTCFLCLVFIILALAGCWGNCCDFIKKKINNEEGELTTLCGACEFHHQLLTAWWSMWKEQSFPYLLPFYSRSDAKKHANLEIGDVCQLKYADKVSKYY